MTATPFQEEKPQLRPADVCEAGAWDNDSSFDSIVGEMLCIQLPLLFESLCGPEAGRTRPGLEWCYFSPEASAMKEAAVRDPNESEHLGQALVGLARAHGSREDLHGRGEKTLPEENALHTPTLSTP